MSALTDSLIPSAGREMSSRLRVGGEGLMWLIVAVVRLHAAPRVQLLVGAGVMVAYGAL